MFGSHVMATYSAGAGLAEAYAAAMSRRFAGLKVLVDRAPGISAEEVAGLRPVPAEQLWEVVAP